ncbi:hypothetical protein [Kribbella sp. NPDC051770]|uniref:hypothetical protein n=1 Tax=Kribbella sp. NPDC051770 TaxID=3155413 RepID=UPI00343B9E05
MADTTPIYELPYLELGDAPNIAQGLEDLALGVEDELQRIDGVNSSQAAAITALQNAAALLGIQNIRKTADEAVTSNPAVQWDDDLQFTAAANTRYLVEATLFVTVEGNNSTTDFRAGWSMPVGASAAFGGIGPDPAMASGQAVGGGNWGALYGTFDGTLTYGLYSTGTTMITIKGILTNGSSSGTVRFAWSQANSAAQAVTVKANSYLKIIKVA